MFLKANELPIILETRGIIGKVEALVYEGRRVTAFYCNIGSVYYHIPIKDVSVGKDAIIIKHHSFENLMKLSDLKDVYNKYGERVGSLEHIEFDRTFKVKSIMVNGTTIPAVNILNMNPGIIIDMTIEKISPVKKLLGLEKTKIEESNQKQEASALIIEKTPEPKAEERTYQPEAELVSFEAKSTITSIAPNTIDENELSNEIYLKYNYLCDKKLEEDITISNVKFLSGHVIDRNLIEKALINNEIVKLVMSVEE